METSSGNGLTVTFDDETNIITLDWDPETHPEYNIFEDITPEEFCKIFFEYIELLLLIGILKPIRSTTSSRILLPKSFVKSFLNT